MGDAQIVSAFLRTMMHSINILTLIEKRKEYPVTTKVIEPELNYVSSQLDPSRDRVGLVIPSGFLLRRYGDFKALRDLILSDWYVAAIFDLSSIWQPYTAVTFTLLVVDKKKPDKVLFSLYHGNKTFTSKTRSSRTGFIGPQKLEPEYEKYTQLLEEFISTEEPPTNTVSKFFVVDFDDLDSDRLHGNYYDPELIDAERKIRRETFAPLSEIAKILFPRRERNADKGYVLKVRDFKYPLDYESLSQQEVTNVELQKHDIVLTPDLSKAYLVVEQPRVNLTPSTFTIVVRPDPSVIVPEYLCLYFQSEVAKKYSLRYQTGTVIPRLTRNDLSQFPVILPSLFTAQKASSIFENLYLHAPEDLEEFNEIIFSEVDTGDKVIQREFILEGLEKLRISKLALVNRLVQEDLRELRQCLRHDLYKSCLILCGAVLEAILLDWLSDIERVNYYESAKSPTLFKMINRLYDLNYLDDTSRDQAHLIRDRRNLVHPKKYLSSREELDGELCIQMVDNLKHVLEKRDLS